MRTRRLAAPLALLLFAALFLIANRGAYEGYFSADDLDNLSWTRDAAPRDFLSGAMSPRFFIYNFRPAGHLYFHVLGRVAGLEYRWYVAVLHALHMVNVVLLWLLLRRLDLPAVASGAGALWFGFHVGVIEAIWMPMYVFDVLCATFCLLSLTTWRAGRWMVSFVFFWLAYKSKELAVMLPAILAAHEMLLGEKRWKRLIPFLAVSLSFGVQGLLLTPHQDDDYTFRLSWSALARTVPFYATHALFIPWLGLALVALPAIVRDRRLWLGAAMAASTLGLLLFLPGRMFAAYLYLPLAGIAVMLAAAAARVNRVLVAAFFLLWLPFGYQRLRQERRAALAEAHQNRAYVEAIGAAARPDIRSYLYDRAPMREWGIAGALRWFTGREANLYSLEHTSLRQALAKPPVMLLSWDPAARRLHTVVHDSATPEPSYLAMTALTPVWQLDEGWYPLEEGFRWIGPRAAARLFRPPGARRFELTANVGPVLLRDLGKSRVELLIEGASLGVREFTAPGWQTVSWDLAAGDARSVRVEFRVAPEYRPAGDPRLLGIGVVAFGFRP
jgi:hypothetical protein